MSKITKKLQKFISINSKIIESGTDDKEIIKAISLNKIANDFMLNVENKGSDGQFQESIKNGLNLVDQSKVLLDSNEQDNFLNRIEK